MERSATLGQPAGDARRARASGRQRFLSPTTVARSTGLTMFSCVTQGSASLHPGLYASACSAGSLKASSRYYWLRLDRGRAATSAENLLLEMRWREIDVCVLNYSFFKTFAVAVPDLPQLFPRRNSQRTRISLIFFNELSAKRTRAIQLHFDLWTHLLNPSIIASGIKGTWLKLTPVAFSMAFKIAGAAPSIGSSPIPFAPAGP